MGTSEQHARHGDDGVGGGVGREDRTNEGRLEPLAIDVIRHASVNFKEILLLSARFYSSVISGVMRWSCDMK